MSILAIQIQHDERFEDMLARVANVGFRHVAVGFSPSQCFYSSDWEQQVLQIERALEKNGLSCIQTHYNCHDLMMSAEVMDEETDRAILRCTEAAGKLGARWNAYHLRTAINENCSPKKSMEYAKAALTPIVEKAAQHNTGVLIENLPIFPGLFEYKFFSCNPEDLTDLYDYFHCEQMGICWDFGHAHLMKFDEAMAIRSLGDRIKGTHVHSNAGYYDSHFLPTQGTIDWNAVMPALKEYYTGALTLELAYSTVPDACIDSYLAHSYQCLQYLDSIQAETERIE